MKCWDLFCDREVGKPEHREMLLENGYKKTLHNDCYAVRLNRSITYVSMNTRFSIALHEPKFKINFNFFVNIGTKTRPKKFFYIGLVFLLF